MAIEALKSVGAVYQASSTPEIAKEVSQPKTQIIDIQTGSAALAADAVKVNAKEANEQQGSGQESQGKAESENLKKAVEQINQKMSDSEAVFGIHEKTNRITIKIVDKKTKEVIREFPPEETLDMISRNFGRRKKIGGRRYGNSDQWFNIRTGYRRYRTGTGISIFHQERKYRKEADKAFLDTGCMEGNEYKDLWFLQ